MFALLMSMFAPKKAVFAPEKAALVPGWTWRSGYQSCFVTLRGVHIPTCNVPPGPCTKEDMLEAERKQIIIINRNAAAMKEKWGVDLKTY